MDAIWHLKNRIKDTIQAADKEMRGLDREGKDHQRSANTKMGKYFMRVEQTFNNMFWGT